MGGRPLSISRPELIVGASDHEFRAFLHAVMVFSRRLSAVRDFFASRIGVTPPQYEMLSHLRESEDRNSLTVSQLAERLHCTGAFVTTESGKLEQLRLVRKQRDPADGRRVVIQLTPECEARFRNLAGVQRPINDLLFESVGAKQFAVLRGLFPRLAEDGDRALAYAEALDLTARGSKGDAAAGSSKGA